MADNRAGAAVGSQITVGSMSFRVVGQVVNRTMLAGTPVVFMSLHDAQALDLGGRPLITGVVTRGVPSQVPAGLDVLTTTNVANLRAVRDYAARLTGAGTVEWVPDEFVRSGEIVLVDIPPEALRGRIAAGRVYSTDRVGGALAEYFRVSNLEALSELARAWLADDVETVGEELLVVRDRSGGVLDSRYVAECVTTSEGMLAFVPECQRPDIAASCHPAADNRPSASNSTLEHLEFLANELSVLKVRRALVQREVYRAPIACEEIYDVETVSRARR